MNANPRASSGSDNHVFSRKQERVPPRAILFDFDGTLCFRTPTLNEVIHAVIEPFVSLSREKKRASHRFWHYYWAPSAEFVRDEMLYGQARSEPFWMQYLERYFKVVGVPLTMKEALFPLIITSIESTVSQEMLGHDVVNTLAAVKSMGFKLGLLTNRELPILDQLEMMGIAGYFDVIMTASDARSLKPSPLIFEFAAERMQVNPEEVMYVGDNYYTDIAGAVSAGLQAVLVDPMLAFNGLGCPVISTVGELLPILNAE